MCDLKDAIRAANEMTVAGVKSGEAIGYRAGMLRAAEICEARAMAYVDIKLRTGDGLHIPEGQLAPEAMRCASEIRRALKEATK